LKASIGQSFNDAFRDLLGFLRIHPVVGVIICGIANRRGNYRIHLVLVSHIGPPDHRALRVVLDRTFSSSSLTKQKGPKC
jgi:hypothetical protein